MRPGVPRRRDGGLICRSKCLPSLLPDVTLAPFSFLSAQPGAGRGEVQVFLSAHQPRGGRLGLPRAGKADFPDQR